MGLAISLEHSTDVIGLPRGIFRRYAPRHWGIARRPSTAALRPPNPRMQPTGRGWAGAPLGRDAPGGQTVEA
jgi:hypothetical protein